MNRFVLALAAFLVLAAAPQVRASHVHDRWRAISEATFLHPLPQAGLVDGPVAGIAQDGHGFIWFLGGWRLWRWDGHALQPARLPAGNDLGQDLFSIAADRKGDIWVGSARGLYRLTAGTLDLHPIGGAEVAALRAQFIAIEPTSAGPRIIIAGDRTLHRYDPATARLEVLPRLIDARTHALHVDSKGTLWVGSGGGLYSLSLQGEPKAQRAAGKLGEVRIAALHEASDGKVWVGTAFDGAFVRSGENEEFRHVPIEDGGARPRIFSMAEAQPGVMWLGTFGRGIFEIGADGKPRRHHRMNRLLPSSLADDYIWRMMRDRQGMVWIGSARTLSLYDSRPSGVLEVPGDIGSAKGLRHALVHSLLPRGDQLWVGSLAKIEKFDAGAGRLGQVDFSGKELADEVDPVEILFDDGPGGILASTSWSTWRVPEAGAPRPFSVVGRPGREFTNAFARWDGALWMGGTDGLWRVPDLAKPGTNVLANETGNRRLTFLLPDGDTMWIGSWLGVLRLRMGETVPQRVAHPKLDSQFITALRKDPSGRIWIATGGAGVVIVGPQGRFTEVDEAHGLPSRIVADVRFDSKGRAWVSTARGIARVEGPQHTVTPVVVGMEAINTPYRRGVSANLGPDEIVFGGRRGLTIIDASHETGRAVAPPLAITGVSNGGRNRTFEFVALDYARPGQVLYRYRLRGYDETWRQVDSRQRIASFTQLPPGEYTFEAQYSRDGNNWVTPALEQSFSISPHWHERGQVRVGVVLLVALLLLGIYRVRVGMLKRRAQALEKAVADRTADLATANEQLAGQARELEQASLTDPLTGLRNRRFLDQHIEADLALSRRRHEAHPGADDGDLVVILLDLDHFKQVNDRWGHAAGDAVLAETARRLRPLFRETDYLFRWGGEEFLVLARFTSRKYCDDIARRISHAISGQPYEVLPGESHPVTCSTGLCAFPIDPAAPEQHSWRDTLAIADEALYEAKRRGRNTWVCGGLDGVQPWSGISGSTSSLSSSSDSPHPR